MFKSKKDDSEVNIPENGVITLDDILSSEPDKKRQAKKKKVKIPQNNPVGMKELMIEDEEKTKFIENPLPVPKKRVHKELDYMINDLGQNDKYDIEDMDGMDFFDIE